MNRVTPKPRRESRYSIVYEWVSTWIMCDRFQTFKMCDAHHDQQVTLLTLNTTANSSSSRLHASQKYIREKKQPNSRNPHGSIISPTTAPSPPTSGKHPSAHPTNRTSKSQPNTHPIASLSSTLPSSNSMTQSKAFTPSPPTNTTPSTHLCWPTQHLPPPAFYHLYLDLKLKGEKSHFVRADMWRGFRL